jgi:hypothetical protein
MLRKLLKPTRASEKVKGADRSWKAPLQALILYLAFVTLFTFDLAAQATSTVSATTPTPAVPVQGSVYGAGFQTPLQFEGESVPANQVTFSMGASAVYDDNILLRNSDRLGDEAISLDSRLGITRQSEHLSASFDYMPFFLLYRQYNQLDRLNHSGELNLAYRLTSRLIVGLRDHASYQNGLYPALTEQQILSGPTSPTAINESIFPYTTRVLSNTAGLDLTFVKSERTSLTLSGSYNQIKFGTQTAGQPLYNDSGESGGLTFQYRVTEHTSFGSVPRLKVDFFPWRPTCRRASP